MAPYPIFLTLEGRPVLVLGEGPAADRRARTLAAAGARVRRATAFSPSLLDGCALASGADAPETALQALSAAAQARGIPVNIVDRPDLCSFLTPSVIDRDPVLIAVSTGGAAPVLARLLRQKIEAAVAPGWSRLAALAGRLQAEIRARFPDTAERRRVLERLLTGPAADRMLAGNEAEAEAIFREALAAGGDSQGFVWLVGAGPGAADLATLRALRLLGEADTIVHDRLGTEDVLKLARRDATFIDAGKSEGDHRLAQADINALLIRLAQQGQRVVRLKGGDPFIFGRGGEEVAALAAAGVPFAVVPGVTAALACAAAAGIPLTHRDAAQAVAFVTAHRRQDQFGIDPALLRPALTLAIYMGLGTLPRLREQVAPETPTILIESGGTDRARVLQGRMADVADEAARWATGGPVLILINGTARLGAEVAPESKPQADAALPDHVI